MVEKNNNKKVFMISVTDKKNTLNRKYMEVLQELLNDFSYFSEEYVIQVHKDLVNDDLYRSLDEAIQGNIYEGYIVLLDCLDLSNGICNPNVMFEFGGIKNLNKPFVVMASCSMEEFPFDVRSVNIISIPECIVDYIKDFQGGIIKKDVSSWYTDLHGKEKTEIKNFFNQTYKRYCDSRDRKLRKKECEDSLNSNLKLLIESHAELKNEIQQITKFVSNTAEYIDGEAAAFSSLHEAVSKAKYSLRSSRFANQSIVQAPTREQESFMEALYVTSKKLKENFIRIICNNHPSKWQDIYNILFNGGNGSRVYVRKADFSIHFELVVIDEKVTFIHFYQQDHSNNPKRKSNGIQVEKINSTLKIQGSSICKKFANIFDRLHHRDFETATPQDPSRTLLGIPMDMQGLESVNSDTIGCFVIPENASGNIAARHLKILEMFKDAFINWDIDGKDKINMAVGISMLENNSYFMDIMHNNSKLTDEEYEAAMELYKRSIENL